MGPLPRWGRWRAAAGSRSGLPIHLPAEHRRRQQHHVLRHVRRQGLARARQHGFADADRRQQRRQYRHHRRRSHALLQLLGPGAHNQRRLAHRRPLDHRRGRNAHRHQRRHAHHHQFRRCRQRSDHRSGLERDRHRADDRRQFRPSVPHHQQRRRAQQPGKRGHRHRPSFPRHSDRDRDRARLDLERRRPLRSLRWRRLGGAGRARHCQRRRGQLHHVHDHRRCERQLEVIVTGVGSVLTASNSLAIGGGCGCNPVGTLTIADGGVVNSPGATSIGAGSTLNLGTGGLAGAIVTPAIANAGQIIANFTDTLTLAAVISGAGTLSKAGPGTLILTGNNTYTGATTINGGTLIVNGSIADSTVTVNAGGRLGGTGALDNTIINGGTLSPGNSIGTLTVNGNLTMTAAASYLVEISPTNADRTNVAGTATLAGTVQAAFAAGSYVTRNYTILSAAGGRSGTFSALTTANLPAGFSASLSYTATDVTLNLTAALGALTILGVPNAPGGSGAPACAFNINQCNVANALNAFFNTGGTLQAAFQLTNQFLGIMLDPFVDGRNAFGGGGSGAIALRRSAKSFPTTSR